MFDGIVDQFYATFIKEERWKSFAEGLGNTLIIALIATIIGIIIGTLVGVIRVYHAQTGKLKIANAICRAYVSAIRGTPVIIQLMIWYYVIFVSFGKEYAVAIGALGFGINSGAYVSEIIRGGILSIDIGQTEAGRSLGFNQVQTMRYIVLPQALKNALPALGNEFVVLLKETSVIGYIAVTDLTRAADIVRSRTWDAFFPLISVAIIYWVLVTGLSALLRMAERRMAKSDRG
jgi:His/Glu/Gln/Arg/opine family amino acid ABC transporter permease subunit